MPLEIPSQSLDPRRKMRFVSLKLNGRVLVAQGSFERSCGVSKLHRAQAALCRPDEQDPQGTAHNCVKNLHGSILHHPNRAPLSINYTPKKIRMFM